MWIECNTSGELQIKVVLPRIEQSNNMTTIVLVWPPGLTQTQGLCNTADTRVSITPIGTTILPLLYFREYKKGDILQIKVVYPRREST